MGRVPLVGCYCKLTTKARRAQRTQRSFTTEGADNDRVWREGGRLSGFMRIDSVIIDNPKYFFGHKTWIDRAGSAVGMRLLSRRVVLRVAWMGCGVATGWSRV